MTTNSNVPPLSQSSAAGVHPSSAARLARAEGEHTRITAMVEKATQAFVRQAAATEVNAILLELSGYTLTHFREEEDMMRQAAFPGFQAHKDEHDRLAVYVRGLLDMRSKQEALRCALNALDLWLDAHIRITDKEFFDYLRRNAK
jgi:hemerythrin-like metal-binding protein